MEAALVYGCLLGLLGFWFLVTWLQHQLPANVDLFVFELFFTMLWFQVDLKAFYFVV